MPRCMNQASAKNRPNTTARLPTTLAIAPKCAARSTRVQRLRFVAEPGGLAAVWTRRVRADAVRIAYAWRAERMMIAKREN